MRRQIPAACEILFREEWKEQKRSLFASQSGRQRQWSGQIGKDVSFSGLLAGKQEFAALPY